MTLDARSTAFPGNSAAKSLVILPSIGAVPHADGQITITRKFLDGAAEMAKHWDGPLEVILPPIDLSTDNLDSLRIDPRDFGVSVKVVPFEAGRLMPELAGAGIVLASVYYQLNDAAAWCRQVGVPCVYVAEYTLRTRLQILGAEVSNPLIRARRRFWEYGQERKIRAGLRLAAGVQCNGTPTYDAYHSLSASPLLFFDGRIERRMLISPEELDQRLEYLRTGRPLRLAFSGRLIRMKGADHLPLVARELKRRQVPFEMTICGDGVLADSMRQEIHALGLDDCVHMPGVLDFATELLPFVKREVDLFVCCHRQGDPSCTYIETMSCGVPIVGYANEALAGILQRVPAGIGVPMNDISSLVSRTRGRRNCMPSVRRWLRCQSGLSTSPRPTRLKQPFASGSNICRGLSDQSRSSPIVEKRRPSRRTTVAGSPGWSAGKTNAQFGKNWITNTEGCEPTIVIPTIIGCHCSAPEQVVSSLQRFSFAPSACAESCSRSCRSPGDSLTPSGRRPVDPALLQLRCRRGSTRTACPIDRIPDGTPPPPPPPPPPPTPNPPPREPRHTTPPNTTPPPNKAPTDHPPARAPPPAKMSATVPKPHPHPIKASANRSRPVT